MLKRVAFALLLTAFLAAKGIPAHAVEPETVTITSSLTSKGPFTAKLLKPSGAGPFPAVVALHGCGGLLNSRDQLVRLDGVSRADRDACTCCCHSAHCFLHRFERGSKIGAVLRLANGNGEMFDRYRVFVNDAVERPCDSARFAERLHERRIVAPFFGAQLFG